ncbi:hypothetical protein CAPTEDRAFT_208948 [Capitella teleta]|uniref:Uncharacterized protein n=1 Tax=Capitella teleta TaxID=283909 RepID=R7U373_CAPTE|nr:hypothetical protein CAPTEDRAFT_208948 [Capitella teleta]|eukprot:ELT97630.1 hypothetical protein CAPTEDRAFT_208948 [Capitella teleta]
MAMIQKVTERVRMKGVMLIVGGGDFNGHIWDLNGVENANERMLDECAIDNDLEIMKWNTSARPSGLWYLVSNEGLRKGCLPQQLMLYPGFFTMTEGKVDDLVENFKEVLNKENYEELHLPFSENVRLPLEEALVKMSELFTLERSSSLRSHTLDPKAFQASLEAMLATVQKQ